MTLSTDRGALHITAQMVGAYPRFNVIAALALHKGFGKQTDKRIEKLRNKTTEVGKRRNRFVHDAWYMKDEMGEASQFKSFTADDPRFGFQPITDDYATETIRLIREKISEVSALKDDLLKSPPATSS
jgi:hypothetical protein